MEAGPATLFLEQPRINYTYEYAFNFEEDFDYWEKRRWMKQNWHSCFYYVGIYMLLIFGGRQYMQSRPRFELRGALIAWNVFLALFSTIGTIRTLPELFYVIREFGFHHSVCNTSYAEVTKVSGFWTWMFILSKVPELGDTIFIVLRKQPLIFLHWYHHVTVLLYTWYSFTDRAASGRWFICMNYTVHSFMYTYYALKAARFRIPRSVSMIVTLLQLSQMVLGVYVNVWSYRAKANGDYCVITDENIKISFMVYFSYFLLFAQFFYNAYVFKRNQQKQSSKQD